MLLCDRRWMELRFWTRATTRSCRWSRPCRWTSGSSLLGDWTFPRRTSFRLLNWSRLNKDPELNRTNQVREEIFMFFFSSKVSCRFHEYNGTPSPDQMRMRSLFNSHLRSFSTRSNETWLWSTRVKCSTGLFEVYKSALDESVWKCMGVCDETRVTLMHSNALPSSFERGVAALNNYAISFSLRRGRWIWSLRFALPPPPPLILVIVSRRPHIS